MLALLLVLKLIISLKGQCKNTPASTQSCGEGWRCLPGLSSRVLGGLRPIPALDMFAPWVGLLLLQNLLSTLSQLRVAVRVPDHHVLPFSCPARAVKTIPTQTCISI